MTKTQFISVYLFIIINLDGTLFNWTDSDAATTKSSLLWVWNGIDHPPED